MIIFNDPLCLFFFNRCQNWHFDSSGNWSPLFREQLQAQAALRVIPALLSQHTPTSTGETPLSCKSLFLYSNHLGLAFPCKAACKHRLINDGCRGIYLTATQQWPPPHFVEVVGPTSDGSKFFVTTALTWIWTKGLEMKGRILASWGIRYTCLIISAFHYILFKIFIFF